MQISVPKSGKINVSAGKLNRLVITGYGIDVPLNINVKDIASVDVEGDALIINGVAYPKCREAQLDIEFMVKLHKKRMERLAAESQTTNAAESKDCGDGGGSAGL